MMLHNTTAKLTSMSKNSEADFFMLDFFMLVLGTAGGGGGAPMLDDDRWGDSSGDAVATLVTSALKWRRGA